MLESLLGIRLVLKMGQNAPKAVSYDVITALNSIQVTDNAVERDTFQMTFSLGKRQPRDYSLLRTGLFQPQVRVSIVLQIGAKLEPLISGVIRHFQLNPSNESGMTTFTVTGDSIDVLLDLKERNDKYERMSDTDIVQQLVSNYAGKGLQLDVADVANSLQKPDNNHLIPRQYATDLDFIQQLAQRNGYVFFADPLASGDVKVYWGPEPRKGPTQPALTMNMGTATNVTSINFTQDSRVPVKAQGSRLQVDNQNKSDESIPPPSSPSEFDENDLAKTETSGSEGDNENLVLMRDIAKYDTWQAGQRAKELMKAKFNSVSANGEVDTVRYGHILRAGQLVGMRGAGALYNGEYYVKQVTHNIQCDKSNRKYTQSFVLQREGLGATKAKVRP